MTEPTVRRLYRSRTDRMVAGICGGFAKYANIDPTLARVIFVLTAFVTGGTTVLGYLILWLVIPEEPA